VIFFSFKQSISVEIVAFAHSLNSLRVPVAIARSTERGSEKEYKKHKVKKTRRKRTQRPTFYGQGNDNDVGVGAQFVQRFSHAIAAISVLDFRRVAKSH
jgi:hypothetical protein